MPIVFIYFYIIYKSIIIYEGIPFCVTIFWNIVFIFFDIMFNLWKIFYIFLTSFFLIIGHENEYLHINSCIIKSLLKEHVTKHKKLIKKIIWFYFMTFSSLHVILFIIQKVGAIVENSVVFIYIGIIYLMKSFVFFFFMCKILLSYGYHILGIRFWVGKHS